MGLGTIGEAWNSYSWLQVSDTAVRGSLNQMYAVANLRTANTSGTASL